MELWARFVNAVHDALAIVRVAQRAAGPRGHGLEARPRVCDRRRGRVDAVLVQQEPEKTGQRRGTSASKTFTEDG